MTPFVKEFPDDPGGAEREWRTLTFLAEHAPGLAPEPIEFDGERVVMTRLQGVPLRSLRVTPEHVTAMAAAVETLHACPAAGVPRRSGEPLEMVAWLRERCTDPAVLAWLESPGLEHLLDAEPDPVIGTGDGNLANFLWDGERIRLIDFEHAGRCDRAYDLAEIAEHVSLSFPSSWFLSHFSYSAERVLEFRRLLAAYWSVRTGRPFSAERP